MHKNQLTISNYNELKSEESNFFRYSLCMEYAGWAFAGSQKQPNVTTVQSEIEAALKQLLNFDINLIFSGRTDRGVHAKNQVAHFDVPFELNAHRFLYSLNAVLSENISVKKMQLVDNKFHSQKSAKFRWYRYSINNKPHRSVWLSKTTTHIHEKLDVDAMKSAVNFLLGKHDFTSFRKVKSPNPVRECVMYFAGISEKNGIINIDLIANRFLYNMVRIIAGTLIEIGKGIYPPEHMKKVLEAQDRTFAGITAEACGLTFMLVGYDEKVLATTNNDNIKSIMENKNNENLLCKAS